MPRRPALTCRQFRDLHAEYLDEFLSEELRLAMRAHGDLCPGCATHDVRIRRSLLALQALPRIEPSADFRERLRRRLRHQQRMQSWPQPDVRWGVTMAAGAALMPTIMATPMVRRQVASFSGR